MNESMKNYNKAMDKFQSANLNKALEFCEEAVALDINNKAALNLKGMILYLKGNLNGAVASWKVNSNINNDVIAKSYLENIEEDENRERLYNNALIEIKKFNLQEGIDFLEKAKESDFNALNVYNALAYCYIKLNYLEKANQAIEKVISIDKSNKVAIGYIKELSDLGQKKSSNYKGNKNKKLIAVGALMIGIVTIGGVFFLSNNEPNKKKIDNGAIAEGEKPKEQEQKEEGKKEQEEVKVKPLKEVLLLEDYEAIYNELEKNRETISVENQENYESAKELLEGKGVKYFYDKGLNEFKIGKFGNANKEFQKGYKYAKDSYLERHLAYMLAVSYEKLEDYDNSIKYYESFEKKYKEGEYLEEVLYKLAILNKDKNIAQSKEYARKLKNNFSGSIYNNDNIKSILE
ncbi:MAG: hypothetical protein ACRDD2_01420 [Sarcina sp.]